MSQIKARNLSWLALSIVLATSLMGCQSLISKVTPQGRQHSDQNLKSSGVAKTIQSESSLCVETAKTMAQAGHAREAILLYEKAENLNQKGPQYDTELAGLYASSGELNKAIARYEAELKKDSNPKTWNNYVWTLMEANQLDNAGTKIKTALQLFPNEEPLKLTFAVLEYRRGDRHSAFVAFSQVLGESAAYHNLGVLDFESGKIEEATKNLRLAIELAEKPNPISVELLGQIQKQIDL